jgi:hypothetical protein
LVSGAHEQEEKHGLVGILWSALADAQGVDDFGDELGFEHVVDFGGAEADPGGVEDAVGAAKEEDLFGCWVD